MNRVRLKWTVGAKLMASFMSVLLVLTVNGGISYYTTGKMSGNAKELGQTWLVGVETINTINYLADHLLSIQYKLFIEKNENKRRAGLNDGELTLEKANESFKVYEAVLTRGADNEDGLNLFHALQEDWTTYQDSYQKVVINSGKPLSPDEISRFMSQSETAFTALQNNIDYLIRNNHNGAEAAEIESRDLNRNSTLIIVISVVIGIILVVLLTWYVRRMISRPIKQAALVVNEVARGNLNVFMPKVTNKDEVGSLFQSLTEMLVELRSAMRGVQEASSGVATSSQEMLAVSEQNAGSSQQAAEAIQAMAAGTEQQLLRFKEVSKTTEDLGAGINRIAESSSVVAGLSSEASRLAQVGNEALARAVDKMTTMNRTVNKAAQHVFRLDEQMKNIGGISKLIGEISTHTNLLALNAAIEAARAGEHGRGFAVVADEVRKLAQQTSDAIAEINAVITQITGDTLITVESMNAGALESEQGLVSVREAGLSFAQITESAELVSGQVQEVAAASQEMAAGSEQVIAAMQHLQEIARVSAETAMTVAATTEEQTASAEQIASSSRSLSAIASEMNGLAAKFKL